MPQAPKIKALHDAVAAYSEKTGVNAKTLGVITEHFVGLLATHWELIADSCFDDDNEKHTMVLNVPITLNLSNKMPVGNIGISFTPKKVSDSLAWGVDDPDQPALPGRS